MKQLNILLLTLVLFSACKDKVESKVGFKEKVKQEEINNSGEKFETLDFSEFNAKLIKNEAILSPKAIMKLFYPTEVEGAEGNEQILMSQNEISKNEVELTLIHENMLDDSLNGLKYIMRLKRVGDKWITVSINKNWKCWDGRGHTYWGIEKCK